MGGTRLGLCGVKPGLWALGTKLGVEAVSTLGLGIESHRRGQIFSSNSVVLDEVGRAKQVDGGEGQQRLVADAENKSLFRNCEVATYS